MSTDKHSLDPNIEDQDQNDKNPSKTDFNTALQNQAQTDDPNSNKTTRIEPTLDPKFSIDEMPDNSTSDEKTTDTNISSENLGADFPTETNDSDSLDDEKEAREREQENQKAQERQKFQATARKRFLGAENIRPFVFIGVAALVAVGIGGYYIVDKTTTPEEVVKAESKANIPNTRAKSDGLMSPEQAAYVKQQQEAAAAQAEQSGGTYIASFINEQSEVDTLSAQPIVQPGIAANQIRQQYFDKQGNSYTPDQALQLAAQNKQIEGVTFGQGSIEDQNLSNQTTNEGQPQLRAAPSNVQAPAFTPYTVTPYSASSRNADKTNDSTIDSEQSSKLDKAASDTAEWQQNYLALRQKKAQLIDQKAQKAFENQVTTIIESIKPAKNGDQTGAYQVKAYKTKSSRVTYDSTNGSQQRYNPGTSTLNGSNQANTPAKTLARTGDSFKAIIKTKVNTDQGNDVLATIISGSLKGSTLMGTVKPTNDNVQITFTKLLRKGKPELAINAVARSLDGFSLGMADSVKRHNLQKYTALVTASLLSGVGQAYQQTAGSNATITENAVVTTSSEPSNDRILGNAAGELGNQMSSDIRSLSKRPTTYIVNQGKVFNLFFNSELVETETATNRSNTKIQ